MRRIKHATWLTFAVIITVMTICILIDTCEARGGRGRGGGSFGGIFGGWRKYKKPTSNSNSRRTVSGSPMHTTASKTVISGSSSSNTMKHSKPESSYPKQQMPLNTGYNSYGGYYGAAGSPPLPQGSTYYPNMGAMPPGAIYYPQHMHSSSGTGNFLTGMMAGHLTSNLLFGRRHYATHAYHQNSEQTSQTDPKIIVVNNGELTTLNETADPSTSSPVAYWPSDTDTPLEPYAKSMTPADELQTGKNPIYQRIKFNNFQNVQTVQAAQQPTDNNMPSNPMSSASPMPPINGIICMPFLLNETSPNDPSIIQQVERVICFPAPPPPTPEVSSSAGIANMNCEIRTLIESDPSDPSKTIEVPKEICTTQTSTSEPRQVAGEIGESSDTDETLSIESKNENENGDGKDEIGLAESATKQAL